MILKIEEIFSVYDKHIENLHFRQGLNEDWGLTTKNLLSYTISPYVAYLTEDVVFQPDFSSEDFVL